MDAEAWMGQQPTGGGDKVDKDPRAGVALCARAAWLGHVLALRELGHCLQDGYGARRDAAAGRHFLLHAAARELVSSSLHHLPPFHHHESTTSFLTSTSTSSASAGLGCGAGTAAASARRRGHGVDGGRERTEAEPQRRDLSEQGLTLGAPPGPLPLPSLLHVEPPRLLALLPGRRRRRSGAVGKEDGGARGTARAWRTEAARSGQGRTEVARAGTGGRRRRGQGRRRRTGSREGVGGRGRFVEERKMV